MNDDTAATANIKRNLDQKYSVAWVCNTQRFYSSLSSCHQIITEKCSYICYSIMRTGYEEFYEQQVLSIVLCILFIVTTCQEYNKDGKVYVSTILGCVFAVVNFIVACTNMAPSLGYDKSHLYLVYSSLVFSLDHVGNSNLDCCIVCISSISGICLSCERQIADISCYDQHFDCCVNFSSDP